MDEFKKILDELLEVEDIHEILFKKIKITDDKIIYFILDESQKIIKNKLTNASLTPIGFIMLLNNEYYYVSFNDTPFSKNIEDAFFKFFLKYF